MILQQKRQYTRAFLYACQQILNPFTVSSQFMSSFFHFYSYVKKTIFGIQEFKQVFNRRQHQVKKTNLMKNNTHTQKTPKQIFN